MSSPLSVAVSGSDADPPSQHDTRSMPSPETGPSSAIRAESPTPTETGRDEERTPAPTSSAIRAESPTPTETGPDLKSVIWSKIAENLVPAVLCGIVVGMFGFVLNTTNIRISDTNNKIDKLEVRMNDKINDLEVKMNDKINDLDTKVDNLDTKVDNLDTKVDEINLKLTALIAALNKTDGVNAAVSGIVVSADP